MARARGKSTPAKKRVKADGREGRAGKPAPAAKRRASAKVAASPKPAPRAEERTPARVPKSTKRSALPPRPRVDKKAGRADPHAAEQRVTPPAAQAPAARAPMRAEQSRVAAPGTHELSPAPLEPSPGQRPDLEGPGHVMELHWGDDVPSSRRSGGLVQRWVKRGDALLRNLAEH